LRASDIAGTSNWISAERLPSRVKRVAWQEAVLSDRLAAPTNSDLTARGRGSSSSDTSTPAE
jgi:hypothetical protein